MKRTRRRYDRAFKISVISDLENGKPLAQIAREHGIHPGLPSRGEVSWLRILTKRSAEMEISTKTNRGLQSLGFTECSRALQKISVNALMKHD